MTMMVLTGSDSYALPDDGGYPVAQVMEGEGCIGATFFVFFTPGRVV